MTTTTAQPRIALGRLFGSLLGIYWPLAQRWVAARARSARQRATRERARSLYARAAQYEATQPGYAGDLRAAAEATESLAARRPRREAPAIGNDLRR